MSGLESRRSSIGASSSRRSFRSERSDLSDSEAGGEESDLSEAEEEHKHVVEMLHKEAEVGTAPKPDPGPGPDPDPKLTGRHAYA